MPTINVTPVLASPYFNQGKIFTCIRSKQVQGVDGRPIVTQTRTPFAGVVTNDDSDVLHRTPEGARITGDIMVHTTFILSDGSDGQSADTVLWRGNRYTVTKIRDWSTYGPGFVAATLELFPLQGSAA